MVPLSTLVDMRQTSGPEFTNRFNLFRAAEVTGTPAPGYSSAQALKALERSRESRCCRPTWATRGMRSAIRRRLAEGKAGVIFLLAIVLVFLILAAQYESWSLPFSVLLGTPFAAFGAFLGLFIARQISPVFENNVFAQIGLVTLIGLAAKNAILIVEFARAELHKGRPLFDSALDAAKLRFRPILMTAFAFILGVVPLMRAAGAGAASRKVMGTTVFSGMLVATILGVLLVPALFVMVERLTGGEKKAEARAAACSSGGRVRCGWRTRRTRRRALVTRRSVGIVLAVVAALSCKVGPGYERPEVAVPETYRFTDTTVYSPDSSPSSTRPRPSSLTSPGGRSSETTRCRP